jgi:PAS domain S-box-containing protein
MKSGRLTIARVFFVAATLLVVSLVSTYWIGLVAIKSNATVAARRSTLQQLEQVISTLRDAETAQRGYLMTGDENALGPYRRALNQARLSFAELRDLGNRGDLPGSLVEDVLRHAEEKVTELEQAVQLRRNSSLEPALSLVRATEQKRTLEKVRASIGRMTAEEQVRLDHAARRATQADTWRTSVFLITIAFNLAFLAWSYSRVLREMRLREQAASELQRQKELLATTLVSIGDGVIAVDSRGGLTFLNPEAERLTGWLNAEATAKPFSAVFKIVDEKTREPIQDPVDLVLRGVGPAGVTGTVLLVSKTGSTMPIGTSAAPIRQPGGSLEGAVVVFRDISEVIAARETLARGKEELEHLVQARTAKLREMIQELQHISYSITHDMRAPLRAMAAFAQILLEDTASSETSAQSKDYCRRILVAAGRMDTLIRDALSFTRAVLHELPLQPINLSILLRGMIDTYPNLQPKLADIAIEGALPTIVGNESLLTQCFANLLDNAVKFVPPGVRPQVRIRAEPNGTTVRIWIEDNGIGIPKHSQSRLFGMFQKLDTQYEGTGIGLAIVRKVAQRMGGSVGLESDAGSGSRFWVDLRTPNGS